MVENITSIEDNFRSKLHAYIQQNKFHRRGTSLSDLAEALKENSTRINSFTSFAQDKANEILSSALDDDDKKKLVKSLAQIVGEEAKSLLV